MTDFDCFALLCGCEDEKTPNASVQPTFRYCLMREIGTQTENVVKEKRRVAKEGGCKKTEEKDKFWLRAFRSYMMENKPHLKSDFSSTDRSFWREYLSSEGKPERSLKFRSYGKQYKNYLFSHTTFSDHFRRWVREQGETELARKYPPQRHEDTFQSLFEYAVEVLVNYKPKSEKQPVLVTV